MGSMFALLLLEAQSVSGLAGGIATIISALAWPVLILAVLIWFRKPVAELLKAATDIAASSSKVKIWQIEFDRDLRQELDSTVESAQKKPLLTGKAISSPDAIQEQRADMKAASNVNNLVVQAPTTELKASALDSIRDRMTALARDYDALRIALPSGGRRTQSMNVIASQMRTLGLASIPFLDEFAHDQSSAGKRLAAVCILQMEPDLWYLDWLGDRMGGEQPFIFFQASIALSNMAHKYMKTDRRDDIRKTVEAAIATLASFKGTPDQNTLDILNQTLQDLK